MAGGEKGVLPVVDDPGGEAVVDGGRGQVADAAVAVLGVVPGEELAAEGQGIVEAAEAVGVAGVVFQGLESALGEGVIVRDVGAGEALDHAEALQLLAEGEGRRRRRCRSGRRSTRRRRGRRRKIFCTWRS